MIIQLRQTIQQQLRICLKRKEANCLSWLHQDSVFDRLDRTCPLGTDVRRADQDL